MPIGIDAGRGFAGARNGQQSVHPTRSLFMIQQRRLFRALVVVLFFQAFTFIFTVPAHAQGCGGGVELWRELRGNGELVIHCRRIEDLTADEWRNLSPAAVSALSKEDRARLDARRKALGIILVVSPSQNLAPETRDFFERQVAMLEAKRHRAQKELDKINASREVIDQAAIYNGRVIRDLTADSVSHSLNVLEGILLVYGGAIPAESMEKIKAAISTAKVTAYSMATALSEPDSDRQAFKLLETLNAMKNLLPASVVGIDAQEWAAIKRATDTFPKMISISQRIVNTPSDKNLWSALAASVDDMIDIVGSLPVAGAPIKAAHSAALLLDSGVSLWYLRHDNYDLREASAGSQTARRYWMTRLGEIDQLQTIYKASLSGTGELNLEDLP